MAPLSVGKLLICELHQGMVSWRGSPDTKLYLFLCLGSLNDTGDWTKREQVVSFWGEVSTFEEILAISAGASEFSYNTSTPTNHTLRDSSCH